MPTYRNDGTKPIVVGAEIIGPGIGPVPVKKYAHPDQADLVLVSHEPRTNTPVVLFADTLPSEAIEGLAAYSEIHIYNQSGDSITITYNEDTANAQSYPDGLWFSIDNYFNYHSMTITGSGSGTVQVSGVKPSFDEVRGMPILGRVA